MAAADDSPSPTRRSARVRKPVVLFGQDAAAEAAKEASPPAKRQRKKASPAAEAKEIAVDGDQGDAGQDSGGDDEGLHAVLCLKPDEIDEYEGWTELESDPALFNHILHSLGISGVRCEEVLAIAEEEVMLLEQPIHGFIFLYECDDSPEAEQTVDPPEGMWFARQTIANACASVALFNILMNAEGINLGDEMQKFKDETAPQIPPHRGIALAQNRFIRRIHDSFARRLDLLDEDLCLVNQYDEYQKQNKKKRGAAAKPKAKQSKKRKRKAAIDPNAAKHYVAYIRQGEKLWELDGLEEGAIDLGPAGDNWIRTVMPFIQEKANALGLQANLIALCHNPRAELRQKLASNVASLVALQKDIAAHPGWNVIELEDKFGWAVDPARDEYAAALTEMGLTAEEVTAAAQAKKDSKDGGEAEKTGEGTDDREHGKVEVVQGSGEAAKGDGGQHRTAEEAKDAAIALAKEHVQIRADYNEERQRMAMDTETASGRQTDLTGMVHTWVQLMCEADIIDAVADELAAGPAGGKGARK